jgi:uncharacterized protein RhaS with RHS repeats
MYDPKTGRFMQRDPIGYHDGMNLQEYMKSNPVTNRDPSGLKVLKLVVTGEGGAGDPQYEDQSSKVLDWYFKNVNAVLTDLGKITPEIFEAGKKGGRVTFNGKPFAGSLEEYKDLLTREKESLHIVQTAGGYEAAKKKAAELAAKADKDYDQIVIEAHGVYGEEDAQGVPIPLGKITFNGELIDTAKARKELADIGSKATGKYIMVSCFTVGALKESSGYNAWPGHSTGKAGIDYEVTKRSDGTVIKRKPVSCLVQFNTLTNIRRRQAEPGSTVYKRLADEEEEEDGDSAE